MRPKDKMIVQLHLEVPAAELPTTKSAQREAIIASVEKAAKGLWDQWGMFLERILMQRNDGEEFPAVPPTAAVSSPEDWRCRNCGGQLVPETAGMFRGKRWIHTCGVTMRSALKAIAGKETDDDGRVPAEA